MDLSDAARRVARWARREPLVLRVYFFGSRVKGMYRPESDLDVAIEIDPEQVPTDTDAELISCWFAHKGQWQKALQSRLAMPVDLDWHHPRRCDAVRRGLAEAGRLVYEKKSP